MELILSRPVTKDQVYVCAALPTVVGTCALTAIMFLGTKTGTSLFDFGRPVPLGPALLQVPALVLLEGVFLLGVGYFLAGLTVHFRDVKDLLATALSLWFFATPVLYPLVEISVPGLKRALAWNPAAPLFTAWQDALFFGRWLAPGEWALVAGIAAAAFLAGFAFFSRLRDSYPEAV